MGHKTRHWCNVHIITFMWWRQPQQKFGLRLGIMQLNTQNEKYKSICIIIRVILPVYFYTHHVQQKYTDSSEYFTENAIHNLGYGAAILAHFYKMNY